MNKMKLFVCKLNEVHNYWIIVYQVRLSRLKKNSALPTSVRYLPKDYRTGLHNRTYRRRQTTVDSASPLLDCLALDCLTETVTFSPQSTYIYRVQSRVWRLPNYWTPIPSPPSECALPPHHTRRAVRGWGVNISEDDRHWIGLLQYKIGVGEGHFLLCCRGRRNDDFSRAFMSSFMATQSSCLLCVPLGNKPLQYYIYSLTEWAYKRLSSIMYKFYFLATLELPVGHKCAARFGKKIPILRLLIW